MGALFNAIFYEPIFTLLVFIYERVAFGDLGIAIIILTVLIRVVLLPLFYKSAKHQTLVQKLQPDVEKIKREFKKDKEKQSKALLELYKEHKINPFSGILILIIQLPVFLAIFKIFRSSEVITAFDNATLFGILDLGEVSVFVALIAAGLQFLQSRMLLGSQQPSAKKGMPQIGKMMVYFAPALTFIILLSLPSALGLYWVVSTIFSVGQQAVINRKLSYISKKEEPQHNGRNNKKNRKTP